MSVLHKLFKELQKLSDEDREMLYTAVSEDRNVRRLCKDMGVRCSDKIVAKYTINRYINNNACVPTSPSAINAGKQTNNAKKIEKIIMGDNLDIIEEAARKKGLI